MLRNYLKIAFRNLVNNKIFSFINIVGLAAGLSCCMLICLYIYDELSYDTQHKDVQQLYQIGTVVVKPDGETKTAASPYPLAWYATNKWLQGFAYKVSIEWWVFAGGGHCAIDSKFSEHQSRPDEPGEVVAERVNDNTLAVHSRQQ